MMLFKEFCEMSFSFSVFTFLVFISKFAGDLSIRDFRPINLVGCVYKLIANVLVKGRHSKVLRECQLAFFEEREIFDATVIRNEQ